MSEPLFLSTNNAAWKHSIDEIDRLRRLIDERADRHLSNWGVWRRQCVATIGYADHVPGLGSGGRCVAEDASDHDYDEQMMFCAEVSDAIIDGLDIHHRISISNVYEASVWRFRSTAVAERTLMDAAAAFWRDASARGLT